MTNREDESRPSGDKAMNAEKLLPCPFCGGDPRFTSERDLKDGFDHSFSVFCEHCGISVSAEYGSDAAEAWNRRTPDPAVNVGAVEETEANLWRFWNDKARDLAAKNFRLIETLRKIANCGQTAEPDHWQFRVMARDLASSALTPQGEETPAQQAHAPLVDAWGLSEDTRELLMAIENAARMAEQGVLSVDGGQASVEIRSLVPMRFRTAMEGWQDISTAPVGKSVIICTWWKHNQSSAFRAEGYLDRDTKTWRNQDGNPISEDRTQPTHWQHLPAYPSPQPTSAISPHIEGENDGGGR